MNNLWGLIKNKNYHVVDITEEGLYHKYNNPYGYKLGKGNNILFHNDTEELVEVFSSKEEALERAKNKAKKSNKKVFLALNILCETLYLVYTNNVEGYAVLVAVNSEDIWSSFNENGWTYQNLCPSGCSTAPDIFRSKKEAEDKIEQINRR